MDSALDHHGLRALLEWQVELGADEATCEAPVDRYQLPAKAPQVTGPGAAPVQPRGDTAPTAAVPAAPAAGDDPVAVARAAAEAAGDLDALRGALAAFEHCELKRGARNLVFSDGVAGARVMIIGEAPGREEDRAGLPFVGRAGQMLDRMLAPIGLSRAENVYITNIVPWRPPQNADPKPAEIAMMRPFMARHVALAGPDLLILMGNISCDAALGQRGMTKLRGTWCEAWGRPALPMFHPAYLMRRPEVKREAWADLLEVQAKLREGKT